MRVAVTLIGGKDWTGGYNYLLNLFDVLIRHQAARLTAVMFVGEDCGEESAPFQAIEGLELVRTPFLNARRRKTSLLQAVLWGRDANMQRVFRQHRIDMVFEAANSSAGVLGFLSSPGFQISNTITACGNTNSG